MTPPVLQVQAAFGAGDIGLLGLWSQCLEASVGRARGRGLLGAVHVVIGDRTTRADLADRAPADTRQRPWADTWSVRALHPDTGPAEAHNRLVASDATADLVLRLDPDALVGPTGIAELLTSSSDPGVGLVEAHRLPVESAKPYELDTCETSWAAGACCLIRRAVLTGTGGYDAAEFPDAGADIDLSWKARLAGWRVGYAPRAVYYLRADAGLDDTVTDDIRHRLAIRYGESTLASDLTLLDGLGDRTWQPEQNDPPPPLSAPTPIPDQPFLTVVVRTRGTRVAGLAENLLSLTAQTSDDFEVVLACHNVTPQADSDVDEVLDALPKNIAHRVRKLAVSGGGRARPLNAGVDHARGRYVTFLDDDDLAFERWVEMFQRVAEAAPGAIAWTSVALQNVEEIEAAGQTAWRATDPPEAYSTEFDLMAHLRENGTPNCGIAIPLSCFRDGGIRFREELNVLEDWDLILQAVQLRPTRTTGCVTALYRRGTPGNSHEIEVFEDWGESIDAILGRHDDSSFVVQGQYLPELRDALDDLDRLRADEEAAESLTDMIERFARGLVTPEAVLPLDPSAPGAVAPAVAALRQWLEAVEEGQLTVDDAARHRAEGAIIALETFVVAKDGDEPSEEATERAEIDGRGSLTGKKVVIVSPHLDDAVLSCGELIGQLADCVVLTVFAGDDVDWSELREWDALSGFEAGTNVVAARIVEDDASLSALGARGVRLDFLDAQYREPGIVPSDETLGIAIADAVAELAADAVLIPLGLTHPDHRLTGAGGRHASGRKPDLRWIAYQDLPYAYEDDDAVAGGLTRLRSFEPTPLLLSDRRLVQRKRVALDCYPSQMATLGDRASDALRAERFWQLTTSPGDA